MSINNLIDEFIAIIKSDGDKTIVSKLIDDVFLCDFNKPLSFSQAYAYELQNFIAFAMANRHVFKLCMELGLGTEVCMNPKILGEVCELFPKRLIMDHNVKIGEVEKLLDGNDSMAGPAIKGILLVRDPRAVAKSREIVQQCDSTSKDGCVDVPKLCSKLEEEVNTGDYFLNLRDNLQ